MPDCVCPKSLEENGGEKTAAWPTPGGDFCFPFSLFLLLQYKTKKLRKCLPTYTILQSYSYTNHVHEDKTQLPPPLAACFISKHWFGQFLNDIEIR